MSSAMRTEIFTVILTLGLGLLVHSGKSQIFSSSFVELKAEQEQTHFFCLSEKEKNERILHNLPLAMGMQGMA